MTTEHDPYKQEGEVNPQGLGLKVSWSDLHYGVGGKEILKGLSGVALPGRTLAVMGASGAGKTTFLNALCERLLVDKEHTMSGELMLNNIPYDAKHKKVIAFVAQDDIATTTSTPAECFRFSVRVRRGVSVEVAEQRVDNMIEELHLEQARDTPFGIPGLEDRGLSGGEKKRTNVGIELITDPKILLLDEPTSGLDSVTAVKIASMLKELAQRGRTIIFTIHQPSAEALQYFDDIMLMCHGKCIYHGPMEMLLDYFAKLGYVCPDDFTPTDYLMTVMHDPLAEEKLIAEWSEEIDRQMDMPSPTLSVPKKSGSVKDSETYAYLQAFCAMHTASAAIQFVELQKRALSNVYKNRQMLVATMMQSIFFGAVSAILFANITDDVEGVADRQGIMFLVIINRSMSGVMNTITTFIKDKVVFIREQQSDSYSPFIYFLTRMFAELPLQALAILVESCIIYFSAGLHNAADSFFMYFIILFFTFQVATGIGLLISAAVHNYLVATGMAPMILIPFIMVGGLFGSTGRIRPNWYWLEKISFCRYGYVLMAKNEFENLNNIGCSVEKYNPYFCLRQPLNGTQVLHQLGFDEPQDSKWLLWTILAIMFCLGRVATVAALYRVAQTRY